MSYTMKDFQRDYVKNHLGLLSPDEVLDKFSPDEVLQHFTPDEVLEHFTPDEVLERLSLKDRLKGISPEEIELYLENLGKNREK
ncbi:hypothetical protein [Candidatus Electrothrix sp.]|uniref:hypothetical protein n=1 Tax=Candidatus Electrothrix sp. TaxID=2170559 RepID=UPI0040567F41